jgi:hypothetical protein
MGGGGEGMRKGEIRRRRVGERRGKEIGLS